MINRTKPLGRQLFEMTWPMVIGVLAIMTNQLVDSAFIGQLGVEPLAVVGFTIPVYQIIIGVQVGLGIATTAVVSMAMGADDKEEARKLSGLVVLTGFFLIMFLCFVLWFHQEALLSLMGAEDRLFPVVRSYWAPWLVSSWAGAVVYFGYSIFRSRGYTMLPGMVMVLTSVLNIILDPIFIFVFDLGLSGAAWATVCAFGAGGLIVYKRIFQEKWLDLPKTLEEAMAGIKHLGGYMAPAMISQFMPPLSAMAATGIVASYGASSIAAWGLGTRLEFFSIVLVLGLTMALPPMIGRLRGQGDFETIHRLVKIAVSFVLVWQFVVAIFWLLTSDALGALLTNDIVIMSVLKDYLWRVPFGYGPLGVCMVMVSVSSAIGMPMRSLTVSVLRLFACYLPMLWIGSQVGGLDGLFTGAMIGNCAAGVMGWVVYKNSLAKVATRY